MKNGQFIVGLGVIYFAVASNSTLISADAGLGAPVVKNESFRSPPPAPPVQERKAVESRGPFRPAAEEGTTEYSIGDFGPEAQLYVELINRARADPLAEARQLMSTDDPDVVGAIDFFSSDLTVFLADMATLPATPPLAPNEKLTRASEIHSQYMLEEAFQGHIGPNGTDGGDRATAQGYEWDRWSENVFSFAESVFHGHTGFEIDWGNGPNGLQDPPNHRLNIHSDDFREVGIGVVHGTKDIAGSDGESVGPQLVTQLFGRQRDESPFITGVVYYDLDGDTFYDLNEGIGDVKVEVDGSSFFGVTARSGGYAVPVPGNGTYTVELSGPGLRSSSREVTIANEENVKLDFLPDYTPPTLTGPEVLRPDRKATFTFTSVGAAKAYQWESSRRTLVTEPEGFETKLTDFRIEEPLAYSVRQRNVAGKGGYSLQLAHVLFDGDSSFPIPKVVWDERFLPGPDGELTFQSRLGWATETQEARIQVSVNEGADWQTIWSQAGTHDEGESDFTRRVVSLGSFAGQEITIRFVYAVSESGFTGTDDGVGWYFDDLRLTDTRKLLDSEIHDSGKQTQFAFSPEEKEGEYQLRARAKVSDTWLPWGPAKIVDAHWQTKATKITRVERVSGAQLMLHIKVLSGLLGGLELQKAPSPAGPWTKDADASLSATGDPTRFRFRTNPKSGATFYRAIGR